MSKYQTLAVLLKTHSYRFGKRTVEAQYKSRARMSMNCVGWL